MKKLIFKLFTLAVFAVILPSCVPTGPGDLEQELIYRYMPDSRETCLKYGTHGEYSYRIYTHGIELQALSPDLNVHYAEVWDVNHDGKLESVWAQEHEKWRYSSMIDHSVLTKDPDPWFLTSFIGLGNQIRIQSEKEKPEGFVQVLP